MVSLVFHGGHYKTGTTSVQLVHGVATFPTLQLSKAGAGFTLLAATPGLPIVVSSPWPGYTIVSSGSVNNLL